MGQFFTGPPGCFAKASTLKSAAVDISVMWIDGGLAHMCWLTGFPPFTRATALLERDEERENEREREREREREGEREREREREREGERERERVCPISS